MSGRHAKPLELHLADGKSRLTDEEKELRKAHEARMRIGNSDFKMTATVKKSKVARAKWNEIIDYYRENNFTFVTTADTAIIERYCMNYARYISLQNVRFELDEKYLDATQNHYTKEKIDLWKNIDRCSDELRKDEETLYLDPQSRINRIPSEKPKEKEEDPEKEMFG